MGEEVLDKIKIWTGPHGKDPHVKIVCMVYTVSKDVLKMVAQYETWGQHCDEFRFMSDQKLDESSHIKLPIVVVQHEGPEEWNNMWQKVRSIWQYAYKTLRQRENSGAPLGGVVFIVWY